MLALEVILFVSAVVGVIALGIWKSRDPEKEGGGDASDYFLAGRGLTWWLVGFSLIAAIIVYQPVLANGVVAIICGIGAGLIAGKLWKAIQAIVGILGALYVAGFFIGSYGGDVTFFRWARPIPRLKSERWRAMFCKAGQR